MSVLKRILVMSAATIVAAAATAGAQTPPPQQPPATQTPAKPTPPATQTPAKPTPPAAQEAKPPAPPAPFPEGAKIAYVNLQAIAANSSEGKAASAKLDALRKTKSSELAKKNEQLQALQTKLQQGGSVLNDAARAQTEKDIEKLNREIQFFQQDANTEIQDLNNQLMQDFQTKLQPVLEQIASEKGLHMLIDIQNSGAVWANPGLDLSSEVIKRFDAAKPPVKK
jgi:outer membrane protein